jgi:cytochrome c553
LSGGGAISRASRAWAVGLCLLSCLPPLPAAAGDAAIAGTVPAWLFPQNPLTAAEDNAVSAQIEHLKGSRLGYTQAQLTDLLFAPDWHPESHAPPPQIVLHGREPGVYACGYCHLPTGQGRPENSSLAGLPAAYIVQQVLDMKAAARHSAWHGAAFVPVDLMRDVAATVSDMELAAAAGYFAAQPLRPRVTVIERARIPRMRVAAWIYVRDPRGGEEPLGQRLIEWAPDLTRHERRDEDLRYTAFVPPCSVNRGREIAMQGLPGVQACAGCHGQHLRGTGLMPPLAGRSPTYLLRQLVAFQTRDRAGLMAVPMQAVVAKLQLSDLIAVAAYAASESAN